MGPAHAGYFSPLWHFDSFMNSHCTPIDGIFSRDIYAKDDGLEKYYTVWINRKKHYLLTNNIPLHDREVMARLYRKIHSERWFAGLTSLLLSFIIVPNFKAFNYFQRAWKILPFCATAYLLRCAISLYYARYNSPMFNAYLDKYKEFMSPNLFMIKDRQREWFDIDDSVYMNYTNEQVDEMFEKNQVEIPNYTPIPNSVYYSNSWIHELNNYLNGKPHKLKEHELWVDTTPNFIPYKLPTAEEVHSLYTSPLPVREKVDVKQ